MTGKIVITGISEAEKAAKEILEHIQAIKDTLTPGDESVMFCAQKTVEIYKMRRRM